MKEDIAKQWVEALRGGKYKQGQEELREDDCFCCLGVLCDISGLSKWRGRSYMGRFSFLAPGIRKWSGVGTKDGTIESLLTSLSHRNDTGSTFEDIATLIEKHWKEL